MKKLVWFFWASLQFGLNYVNHSISHHLGTTFGLCCGIDKAFYWCVNTQSLCVFVSDRFGLIHQARISASVNAMRVLNTGSEVEAAVADALVRTTFTTFNVFKHISVLDSSERVFVFVIFHGNLNFLYLWCHQALAFTMHPVCRYPSNIQFYLHSIFLNTVKWHAVSDRLHYWNILPHL